jgi:Leucine-rich repeat (LRR) protein
MIGTLYRRFRRFLRMTISSLTLKCLTLNLRLEVLHLQMNQLSQIQYRSGFQKLKRLNLSNNSINSVTIH